MNPLPVVVRSGRPDLLLVPTPGPSGDETPQVQVHPSGPRARAFADDVVIIGGCGHVGLPLGIALASRGLRVSLHDINFAAVSAVNAGRLPFREEGAEGALREALSDGRLRASTDPGLVSRAEHVIVVIGTPVDEHLNPDPQAVPRALMDTAGQLVDGQLLVLRSTIYPGVTAMVERLIEGLDKTVDVAFCPERIAEGRAMTELVELPQIVAARTERAGQRAAALFRNLTAQIVMLEPEEAELAKLFTNVWRYVKFAVANQLFMIANDAGMDFARIRAAMQEGYPRAQDFPGAGFAAGPCLPKDTMQLSAFNNNNFSLGQAAMLVNEGLPLYLVSKLQERYCLETTTFGILGMAFKGESDDTRASLAYKLRRILEFRSAGVLCTDPYIAGDDRLVSLESVLERADVLIVAAPHAVYGSLRTTQPVVDVWDLLGEGTRV